jgi:hypothetical protein
MTAQHKRSNLPKRVFQLGVAALCLAAVMVVGQSQQERASHVLLNKRETVNSIPLEYGRLIAVERSSDGTMLYFESQDGTIRFVSVIYGIDHGSLKFKAVTVPRS